LQANEFARYAPNWITIGRIILVPLFVVLALGRTDSAAIGAFWLFAIASASDILDGYLARRSGFESRLGQFLDPLADKLLIGAALIALVAERDFPIWVAIVIAVREIAVTWLRVRIVTAGGDLPASKLAKLKTLVQMGMVSWWLLPWDSRNIGHWLWVAAALVWTAWSGAYYFTTEREVTTEG